MKVKTSELTDTALDWVVGTLELVDLYFNEFDGICRYTLTDNLYSPSTNWAQGGPIIEREGIATREIPPVSGDNGYIFTRRWIAEMFRFPGGPRRSVAYGTTPLVAAMRCFCCAKLGEFVDIPEELCQQQKN